MQRDTETILKQCCAMQGGSVDKCLSEEYENLLEAVLSVPLAIMSSVLHDVCATLTFRAAAAAARDLQAPPHRWRHHLSMSTSVSCVQARSTLLARECLVAHTCAAVCAFQPRFLVFCVWSTVGPL